MAARPSVRDLRGLLSIAEQRSTDAVAFAAALDAARQDGQKAADRLVKIIAADPLAADGHDASLDQALAHFAARMVERRAAGASEADGLAYYITAAVAVVEALDRCMALARAGAASPTRH
ncbi:hypothetical protein EEDFHM_04621 [Methylorubrum populi]